MTASARRRIGRWTAAGCGLALVIGTLDPTGASAAAAPGASFTAVAARASAPAFPGRHGLTLRLPDGSRAMVDPSTAVARVTAPDGTVMYRRVPAAGPTSQASADVVLPDKAGIAAALATPPRAPYAPDHIIVVFSDRVAPRGDVLRGPRFTGDRALDAALTRAHVVGGERLFGGVSRDRLRGLTARATASHGPVLGLANAYRLDVRSSDPVTAAQALLPLPGVELASLDFAVQPTGSTTPLSRQATTAAAAQDSTLQRSATDRQVARPASSWLSNYGIRSSAQSYWNSPGLDATAAFDEVTRTLGRLPGRGQVITDVGIGDLSDDNPASRCYGAGFGPTTIVRDGQRYIDLPSMPLVPTWTASTGGRLDPLGEVCGTDPLLRGIGHDLSVMAPLPSDLQRPGRHGHGLTDLLGLAPGARFRVVVPASSTPDVSDVAGALLGAAMQTPRPDVITTGLVASGDSTGFPERFLEQDPLAAAVIATIVDGLGVDVCVATGDGVRRNSSIAAFGPSGGGAETDAVRPWQQQTTLQDIALSTAPSRLHRSGAIAVGATTTDDIFAVPPHYSAAPDANGQPAFAATRWTGATDFASTYGSRVDIAAPGDSILAMSHRYDGSAQDAQPDLAKGTGLSAAEVAAAVAVVRQVARDTGQAFADPRAVRSFLQKTATPVRDVPQADRTLAVGGQLDLRRAVETLFDRAGRTVDPGVVRVAAAQRRAVAWLDAVFETGTNPQAINLRGPRSPYDGRLTGANKRAWITVAPDWQGVPADARFRLTAVATGSLLATTPAARLLPTEILHAAGLPSSFGQRQQVELRYTARWSGQTLSVPVHLGFQPSPRTSATVLAPEVPAVVRGDTLAVHYDLRRARGLQVPVQLLVSYPGRPNPVTGAMYGPRYSVDLPYSPGDPASRVGTVRVPLAQLEGAGIYGVGLHLADRDVDGMLEPVYSDFAYTRVPASAPVQPPAPLVSHPSGSPGHRVSVSYGGRVRIGWDASNVPGADGVALEVSAAGPATAVGLNTFNNPEGDRRDANGVDTGSVTWLRLSGPSGSLVTTARKLGVLATMSAGVRILALQGNDVVGAASPVSTIERHGVVPVGNDPINEAGLAVGDGTRPDYVATNRFDRSGDLESSVQSFDPVAKQATAVLAQTRHGQTAFRMVGNGLFGQTGLVGTYTAYGDPVSYQAIVGDRLQDWTPPNPDALQVRSGAADPSSPRGAFLALDTTAGDPTAYRAFTSDVAANSFSTPFDVSGGLSGQSVARLNQVVYDASSGHGMAGFAANDYCAPPILERFDTQAEASGSVTGLGYGDPFSMAVDRSAGIVAVATSCSPQLDLYDLAAGDGQAVDLGSNAYYVAADDRAGLFLAGKVVEPDAYDNHVTQSSIAVYRSDGTYVEELRGIYLWDVPLVPGLDALQVDSRRRTAWIYGPYGRELAPLHY